jgi:hypothetical protein
VITPIIEIRSSGHHPVARISASIFADLSPASVGPSPTSIGRALYQSQPFFKTLVKRYGYDSQFFQENSICKRKTSEGFFLIITGQAFMYF